jgi:RHS repeat-associated protein
VGLLPFIALLFFHSAQANGNVLATGGKTFTYDSQNQMITMAASGTAVTMTYDGFGNRVAKTVNGVATRYLVEDDKNPTGYPQVFDELNGAGQVTRTYTYGLQRIDENQILNGAWTPSFYGYDGGGNVRQLTNAAGAVTDTYEYDAFGNALTTSGSTPNNYLYRGEQYDPDLGLYYLRARYYNPATGRFMSRDPEDYKLRDANGTPVDPKALHKYLYAGADPINWIDPRGRSNEEVAQEVEEVKVAVAPEVRKAGLKLALCYFAIGTSIWEIADGGLVSNGLAALGVFGACFAEGLFFPPETPPGPVPPMPWPSPPPGPMPQPPNFGPIEWGAY